MPEVFRSGPLRLFFYSNEGDPREPVHVHVRDGKSIAKVWLDLEVRVADSRGFDARALRRICDIVRDNRDRIMSARHDHFR
jgi:hypothetical protein